MKTKLILCFALLTAVLIGVSCEEASAQSEKDGYNKLADKNSKEFYVDHHDDKDRHHEDKDRHQEGKDHHDKKGWEDKRGWGEREKDEWQHLAQAKIAVQVLMHAVETGRMEEHHAKDMLWELFAGEGGDEESEENDHHREEHHHNHEEEHDGEGRQHEEEALYEAIARGLEAAVELRKMTKKEAEEIWRDMAEEEEEE